MELYVHIPFCVKKCAYCDFLSFPQGEEIQRRYVEKLMEEIRTVSAGFHDTPVSSVFVGGGTPVCFKGPVDEGALRLSAGLLSYRRNG